LDRVVAGRAAIPRRSLNLATIPNGAIGEQDLFDAVGAVELVLNSEELPCRVDLNLEVIAIVGTDEGNVRRIETNQLMMSVVPSVAPSPIESLPEPAA
jgi:hypothetical protein